MPDLLYIFLIVVFSAALFGFTVGCDVLGGTQVSGLYLICGVVAVALFVYLGVALFNAEDL